MNQMLQALQTGHPAFVDLWASSGRTPKTGLRVFRIWVSPARHLSGVKAADRQEREGRVSRPVEDAADSDIGKCRWRRVSWFRLGDMLKLKGMLALCCGLGLVDSVRRRQVGIGRDSGADMDDGARVLPVGV